MALSWETISKQIYEQSRRNEACCKDPQVDIIATKQNADRFHKLLARLAVARHDLPVVIKWHESPWKMLHLTCRTYTSQELFWPRCQVNVLIPNGTRYKSIFAVPDYQSQTYFCFLRTSWRPFPKSGRADCENKR